MAKDPNWLMDTGRSDGGVVLNALDIDMPEYDPGARIDGRVIFWPDSGLSKSMVTRYQDFREYADYAGHYSTMTSINGTIHYRDRVPSSAGVDSIAVDFVPQTQADWTQTDGFWALLDSASDTSGPVDSAAHVDVSLTVLAKESDYADQTALENDLASAVI